MAAMTLPWTLLLTAFVVGVAIGYGIRAVISSRRHARARRRGRHA